MQFDATRRGLSYREAGVDLDSAERAKESLRALVARTRDAHTLSELGSFGGLYSMPTDGRSPVLVSSADGVGTKLKLAFMSGRHDTVGQDLVNHCVNDILVQGARPMFFLDYLATGVLEEAVVTEVVSGVAVACLENGCALLGGETAQMPDFYAPGEYDLAGFIVGVVERDHLIDGSKVRVGDSVIALASSGLQTNGFTLARRIVFERLGLRIDDAFPGTDRTVADVLMTVHSSFAGALLPEVEAGSLRGLVHITGGGIPGNLPRVLPSGMGARIETKSWDVPQTFQVLQEAGGVEVAEMFRVFNMGVGMLAVAAEADAPALLDRLEARGQRAWVCGEIVAGGGVELG